MRKLRQAMEKEAAEKKRGMNESLRTQVIGNAMDQLIQVTYEFSGYAYDFINVNRVMSSFAHWCRS